MTYKNRKAKRLTKRDEKKWLNSNTYKYWKTEWLTKTYRDRMSFKYLQKQRIFKELQRQKTFKDIKTKRLTMTVTRILIFIQNTSCKILNDIYADWWLWILQIKIETIQGGMYLLKGHNLSQILETPMEEFEKEKATIETLWLNHIVD